MAKAIPLSTPRILGPARSRAALPSRLIWARPPMLLRVYLATGTGAPSSGFEMVSSRSAGLATSYNFTSSIIFDNLTFMTPICDHWYGVLRGVWHCLSLLVHRLFPVLWFTGSLSVSRSGYPVISMERPYFAFLLLPASHRFRVEWYWGLDSSDEF